MTGVSPAMLPSPGPRTWRRHHAVLSRSGCGWGTCAWSRCGLAHFGAGHEVPCVTVGQSAPLSLAAGVVLLASTEADNVKVSHPAQGTQCALIKHPVFGRASRPSPRPPAGTGGQWASAQKADVTRQAMLDLRHVIPREIVNDFAGNVRDVDGADLIDQDLGISPRDGNLRPEDRRLGAGRGRDNGHRGPGVLLDADDEPEAPAQLLVARFGIAKVYWVNRSADHARSCDLAGTVRPVPAMRMLPSVPYSHASASAERSSVFSRCMSARARSSHASRSSSRSARRMTSLVFSSLRRLASMTRRSSSVGRNPTLMDPMYNNC